MKNKKLLCLAAGAILLSVCILAGYMALTAMPSEDGKTYSGDGFEGDVTMQDGVASQEELARRFAVYNHEIDDGVLQIFSDEQFDALARTWEDGGRMHLTYDEILFLINDSIRLYNTYDRIVLNEIGRVRIPMEVSASASGYVILPHHGDLSELAYEEATEVYDRMLQDIYTIILYRISMLDNWSDVRYYVQFDTEDGWESESVFTGDALLEQDGVQVRHSTFLLSLDGGKTGELSQYRENLAADYAAYQRKMIAHAYSSVTVFETMEEYSQYSEENGSLYRMTAPLLTAGFGNGSTRISVMFADESFSETVFPTRELIAMEPSIFLGDMHFEKKGKALELSEEDRDVIRGIMLAQEWTREQSRDEPNYTILLSEGRKVTYCGRTGTFHYPYDGTYLTVGKEDRQRINAILEAAEKQ